ncbi:SNF2 family N-terminal domain-containing protein [Gautieria morchelliformis]|nr:SNF2 family N-terminal domain-containing protein [Gautieria morchelliformis]
MALKPSKPSSITSNGPHQALAELEAETFDVPVDSPYDYEVKKTTAEADKELKELFEGVLEDGPAEIDMSEAIVDGFADGITLKPHQIKGRLWMRDRETDRKAGGMLCDDMGLGKTIQTVVRIVDGPPSKEDRKKGWSRTTLQLMFHRVICPVALVKQWAQEIKKYTGGSLRVVEHYGPSRTSDPSLLSRAHVVVTSYNIAASEYAVWSGDAKDKSSSAKTKKKTEDDPESDTPSNDSDSSSNFGKTLKQARAKKAPVKKKKTKKLDALYHIQWWRIVLDEAHNIKNRKTKVAMACYGLSAKYRWALTGTPVQNSVEDLYSLLKFLGIRPLNDWTHFNDTIAKPVKAGRTSRAMKRLHVVMKAIMLRRLKDAIHDGAPLIQLPPRTLEIVPCDFDDHERDFYAALETKTNLTMNKFIKRGEVMHNYTEVLVLLLRLRQACDHPILVSKDFQTDADALDSKPAGKSQQDDDDDDGLADLLQKMDVNEAIKRCDVCRTELDHASVSSTATRCQDCDLQIAVEKRRKSDRVGSELPPSSAKIRKILELLETIDEHSDGTEKTIIFSQFTSMLDLLEPFLRDEGINYVRCKYDGSMNAKQREVSLVKIRENKSTRVIMISFKAGGAGLNLTACNNVILVDLWWNPALEEQAFGRVHRYGQERDVMIYKLTVEQTIEERILALQDKKRLLANAALSGDKFKNNKLGLDDIMALFRPGGKDDSDEE